MVVPAEQDEILESRLAAVSPVVNVVTIDKTRVHTARKAATAVTTL